MIDKIYKIGSILRVGIGMKQRALITGITGQDGSYLAELLLDKGYEVHGMRQRSATPDTMNIEHILPDIHLHYGDLTDGHSLDTVVERVKPDEVYNLAAQSFVGASWDLKHVTWEVNAHGVVRLLQTLKKHAPDARVYQASTSEMFGASEPPQHEGTPFAPVSPYAESKVFAHQQICAAREQGTYAVAGILFNHESPRRGLEFVTRKITNTVAKIKQGTAKELRLGNLDARRDWGYAGDYVQAMFMMMHAETPDDYVIATGTAHSVRQFVQSAFSAACMPISRWEGKGVDERGYVGDTPVVFVDKQFYRPVETSALEGDSTRARQELGWEPKASFDQLVTMMVEQDLCYERSR